MLRNYQVLSEKGRIRSQLDFNDTPLHQLQPVTIHTLHPPPVHTALLSVPTRSAVSQAPPAPASPRKEADQRDKPTVSQSREGTCAEQHSPTQRGFSKPSPGCSLPAWPVPSHLSWFASAGMAQPLSSSGLQNM